MSRMVEIVARALSSNRHSRLGGPNAETMVKGRPNWTFCMDDARMAIKAMRQPTGAMVRAGMFEPFPGEGPRLQTDECYDTWRAMIDAALKSEPRS